MRIVKWKLTAGNHPDQESAEMKRTEGLAYIERLKVDETVLSVEENEKEFIITIE